MALSVPALRGLPCLGSFSVALHIRHIEGTPWLRSYSVDQCFRHLMGHLSIVQLPMLACGEREAMVMAPPPTRDSAVSPCFHGCLTFFHRHSYHILLPHIPLICLSAVNSSPRPGIAPQSLNSSFQLLCHARDLCPCLGYVWLQQWLSDSQSI